MTKKENLILIFSVIDIVSYYGYFLGSGSFSYLVAIILMLTALITYILVWILVAKDIKEKGISWGFMALPIILAGIGGIIYWFINRGKSSKNKVASS